MFLRNHWYVAARADEIGREPLGRILLNEPVVLYRKKDGEAVALEDRCPHRRAPLHKGRIVGDAIRCGYHGFTFAADGTCSWVPGQSKAPPGCAVASYPAVERYKWIWVWMGDPARADPDRIPDFHWQDDRGWAACGAHLPIACNYQLIVDNLMDLSHVGVVHAGSIGSDDSDATLSFDRGDDFARLTRTATDIPPPPIYVKQGFEGRMNQTKTMTFEPPAFVWIDIRSTENAAEGRNAKSAHLNILNAITPETDTSSHYFWGSARDFEIDDEQLTAFTLRETVKAFDEDKTILEAQQKCIDLDPSAPTIDVAGDAGGLHARRIVARLLADEAGTGASRGS